MRHRDPLRVPAAAGRPAERNEAMSFSSALREELARTLPRSKKGQETSAATLLINLCRFSGGESGGIFLVTVSGNRAALKKCFTLIQKTVTISRDLLLKKNVPQALSSDILHYLTGLQILDREGRIWDLDGTLPPAMLRGAQARDYLREMFLCTGFMSDPQQRYHLEFRCFSAAQAGQLRGILGEQGIHAGLTLRKRYFVVYLKDSEDIVTLLQLMGANVTLMATENARILKDLRNTVNRRVNCETANIGKTVETAARQIGEIRYLRGSGILQTLPAPLREAADLREKHPGASLSELGALAVPPVGRSGMNHRLRKLSALAEKTRGTEKQTEKQTDPEA